MGHRGALAAARVMTRPDARALRKLILCATICAVDFAGLAQEPANIEHEIADYCAGRLAYANQHREAALFVSAIPRNSDPTRDRWRRAISPQDFAAARKNGDSIAILWFLRRKLVWADFAFQNQFGDWINQTTYCYRSDGSLALLDSELKSFRWTEGSPRQLLCAGGCLAEPVPGQLGSRHRQTRASASRLLGSSRTGVSSCKRSSLARNLPGRGQSNSTVKP